MVEKESIRVVAEGTLPTGYSDDGGSFNEGEDDVEDGSGHKSVISDDDTRNSPSSRRSSGQDSSQYMMKNGDDDDLTIAKRENQAVMISRMTFIAVLVLITVGISVGVFVYVDGQEQSAFELYFGEDSYLIFSKLGESVYERFAQLDSMTVALASAYINVTSDISAQWPLGTYHDFAVMASKARSLSQAVAFQQYYFVPNNQDVRAVWEDYAREHGSDWITQTLKVLVDDESYQGKKPSLLSGARQPYNTTQETAEEGIQYAAEVLPPNSGPYSPSWQAYPLVLSKATDSSNVPPYNWNALTDPIMGPGVDHVANTRKAVLTQVVNVVDVNAPATFQQSANDTNKWASQLIAPSADPTEPLVRFLYPILDGVDTQAQSTNTISSNTKVLGFVSSSFYWSTLLSGVLPPGTGGLQVVISNDCGPSFSYLLEGGVATYLGVDVKPRLDLTDMNYSSSLLDLGEYYEGNAFYSGLPISGNYCQYNFTTYPTESFQNEYRSGDPIIFMYSVIIIFGFTSVCFLCYDKVVSDRQRKVLSSAQKSNAIISSLFPSTVRDRLYDGAGDSHLAGLSMFQPTKARLKNFLHDGNEGLKDSSHVGSGPSAIGTSKPIADLFTECTVMFADIANFTAWSSVREPGQVFTLLETIYGAFDQIAARRGVFKVETIGDSYVAVTGLPEPRPDHAIAMVRFARDCRQQCMVLSRQLETTLGPDTGDLRMRFGLNSGPVTAGVLRGEKSRFQLFGDTVNTAARMESSGVVSKIHVSQSTADLLIKANRSYWVESREDKVEIKGKGYMQTYWVEPCNKSTPQKDANKEEETLVPSTDLDSKTERLVNWNVVVLGRMIAQIVAHRNARTKKKSPLSIVHRNSVARDVDWNMPKDAMVIHEIKEIIELPDFDGTLRQQDLVEVHLEEHVQCQLLEYVTAIALTYHENPFHNFEHASHVCMSVAKLLSRIVAPDQVYDKETGDSRILASTLHDHTYGITSDPLTQFACVFAALIHDSDHEGVPNSQLVKEGTETAQRYQGKSVAEQNSVNVAWEILLQDKYKDLRGTICDTQEEEARFRQLVVNGVMATDIMDSDLKKLRDERWKKAFTERSHHGRVSIKINNPYLDDVPGDHHGVNRNLEVQRISVNRKATIVIEHLIQASDVAHTMQHWHIYRKWNERLFAELHQAYVDGRAEKDPATFWYQGEIGFFDYYIIPLAKKLSECGVFGVSSDEYLNYALQNRNEWEKKGVSVVEEMLEKLAGKSSAGSGETNDSAETDQGVEK